MLFRSADALRLENRLQAIQSSQPSVATAHELHDFAAALQSLPSLELPVVVQESVSPLPALVEPTLDLEFPVEALAEPSFESLPPSAEELSPESIALEFPEFFEDFDAVHRADAPLPELADVDLESLDAFMLPVPAPVSDETPPFEMEASALEPEWLFDVADQEPEPEALSQALAVEPTADQLDADILAAFEAEIASTGAGQPEIGRAHV